MSFVTGGCLCGAVRLRATLPPHWVAHCHCSMCRRAHGAGLEPQAHAYWSSRAPWADWSGGELPKVDPPDHEESD